jgi:hypothetical protein
MSCGFVGAHLIERFGSRYMNGSANDKENILNFAVQKLSCYESEDVDKVRLGESDETMDAKAC